MLKRENYLSRIRGFYDSDLIKILVGIRRCGKSVILNQIIDEIKEKGVSDDHIIWINFEYIEYEDLKNYKELNKYIKEKIKDEKKYYIFLDEIQKVEKFEEVVNSIRASIKNVSIFITGSNSKLLSFELSTVLSGRYVLFNIYPLSYLDALCKALIIKKIHRYDIHGKKILKTLNKYYMTDLGIAQIKNNNFEINKGFAIENVIYNELLIRGYDVFIGKTKTGEIDFIATKEDKKEYYQVSYLLNDDKVIEREFGAFNNIIDDYPKYVLSLDKKDYSQNGIIHKNIIDWLLEE